MSHNIEIEKKFYATDDDLLKKYIQKNNFEYKNETLEQDIYFTDNKGEYIADRTCLRFRNKGKGKDIFSIDFKGKSKELSALFSKVESNIYLPKNVSDSTYQLLSNLGYQKYVTVNKDRVKYYKKLNDIELAIVIDTISGVGVFFEVELTCPAAVYSQEQANELFYREFSEILNGEFEVADLPYRDFLANKIKGIWLKDVSTFVIDYDSALDFNKIVSKQEYKDGDLFKGNLKGETTQHKNAVETNELESIKYLANKYNLQFLSSFNDKNISDTLEKLGVKNVNFINVDEIENVNSVLITGKEEIYSKAKQNNIHTIVKLYNLFEDIPEVNSLKLNSLTELVLIDKYATV